MSSTSKVSLLWFYFHVSLVFGFQQMSRKVLRGRDIWPHNLRFFQPSMAPIPSGAVPFPWPASQFFQITAFVLQKSLCNCIMYENICNLFYFIKAKVNLATRSLLLKCRQQRKISSRLTEMVFSLFVAEYCKVRGVVLYKT